MPANDPSIWRLIRTLRFSGVAHAQRGPRKRTLESSLEQAEQLFLAGGVVGTSARPIVLFYGMSQLGRALAAAFGGEDWQLSGHGIRARCTTGPLEDVAVVGLRGAFTVVSTLLGSAPLLNSETPLRHLWRLIPEAKAFPLACASAEDPVPLSLRPLLMPRINAARYGGEDSVRIEGELAGLPAALLDSPDPRAAIASYLEAYPSLQAPQLPLDLVVRDGLNGTFMTQVGWSADAGTTPRGAAARAFVLSHGMPYRFDSEGWVRVFPRLSDDEQMHPWMTWWAVLFALSVVARYEPARWVAATDVDGSADAVALEHVLDVAQTAVPEGFYRIVGDREGWRGEARATADGDATGTA